MQSVLRYGWVLMLAAGVAASIGAYGWLRDMDAQSMQIEIALRSQPKLDAIRAILKHYLDTSVAIGTLLKNEVLTHADVGEDKVRHFAHVMLVAHPDALAAIAIIPPESRGKIQAVSRDGAGRLDPPLNLQHLHGLTSNTPDIQEVQNQQHRWLTRIILAVSGAHGTGYLVNDWNIRSMIAIADTPVADMNIEAGIIRDGHFSRFYEHRSQIKSIDKELTWHRGFSLNGIDFEVRTRAIPALLRRFTSTDPVWTLWLVGVLSLLLAYLAYNRSRYSERLRLEVAEQTREIEGERHKLSSIIDHANETVLLMDDQGSILLANATASKLFGYQPAEWDRLSVHDLVPEEIRETHVQWFGEEISGNHHDIMGREREIRAQRKDGSVFPCEVTINSFTTGKERRISVILRNLTARKQREWVRNTLLTLHATSRKRNSLHNRLQKILGCMFSNSWAFLDAGAIFLVDGEIMHLAVCHGWSEKDKARCAQMPAGECLCGKAIVNGNPIFHPHRPKEARLLERGGPDAGYLCMPILHDHERLGMLSLKLKPDAVIPDVFHDFCRQVEEIMAEMLVREHSRLSLEQSEKKHRTLVEAMPLGIFIHQAGKVRFANSVMATMLGVEDVHMLSDRKALSFIAKEDRPMVIEHIQRVQRGECLPPVEERLLRRNGSFFWADVRTTPITYEGAPAVQVLVQDISERKQAEEKLSRLSYHDDLTGLPNRRLFADRADQAIAIAKRNKSSAALLYIDIDRFKFINDTLGHFCGDQVLKETAERLLLILRKSDTAARMGGDEFVVLLQEVDANTAMVVAQKIRSSLHKPHLMGGQDFTLDSSIGIAIFPQDGEDSETMLKHADTAMYHAKQNHTHTHYFSSAMEEASKRRLWIEQELAKAADEKKLVLYYQSQHAFAHEDETSPFPLHYQAKHSLDDNCIVGVEALIRWNHPKLGLISPAEFIPLAEETGIIRPITHWALAEAGRQATIWEKQNMRPGRIAVNISAVQLMQKGLAGEIMSHIRETGAKPEWIEIEITETAAMREPEIAIQIMKELTEAGISIAIDDFGTGYSSLAYLKRLPAESLKIDMAFIRNLPNDLEDAAIVRSTIAMAHALDMQTIAEGVETEAQLEFLRNEGCDIVQGFLLSKPLPAVKASIHIKLSLKHQ